MKPIDRLLAVLGFLGGLGSRAVAIVLVIGIIFPFLGTIFRPYLTEAVFVLLCTSFVRIDMAATKTYLRRPLLVLSATFWSAIIIPILIWLVCLMFDLQQRAPELYIGLMLQAVASPIMSATAFALLLGLEVTLILIVLVITTAIVPFTVPLLVYFFIGPTLTVSVPALAVKLATILCGAAFVGFILRRIFGITAIERQGQRINGLNLIMLFIAAAALMRDVAERAISDPLLVLAFTFIAFVVFGGVLGVSMLVFLSVGKEHALALSLMFSQRNVGLMLAATSGVVPELAWLYCALAQFPIFFGPGLLQPLANRLIKSSKLDHRGKA